MTTPPNIPNISEAAKERAVRVASEMAGYHTQAQLDSEKHFASSKLAQNLATTVKNLQNDPSQIYRHDGISTYIAAASESIASHFAQPFTKPKDQSRTV
ncbi:MAG: hypothetical protein WDN72_05875 [Alphaproteobacteria bacterium]